MDTVWRFRMSTSGQMIDRSSATAIYHYGISYLECANIVVDSKKKRLFDSPVCYLYCHAAELACKSFLRAKGLTNHDLKRLYGHDLKALYQACIVNGISRDKKTEELIDMLNPYIDEHEFRYIVTGVKILPELAEMREIVTGLFVCIQPHVPHTRSPLV